MTEYAYSPMREPRKEVSEEQMLETLKRRVREAVEKHAQVNGSGVAQPSRAPGVQQEMPGANPVTVAALVWEKPIKTSDDGLGYQQSTCHRFVIAKVRVMDRFQYTASMRRRTPAGDPFPAQALGSFYTPEEARTCCEGHR